MQWKFLSLLLVSMGLVVGCGSGPPKTVKVAGTIEFDGQPLTTGRITFVPQAVGEGENNRPATGVIDAQGHYELSTFKPGDGALPGKYLVAVISNSTDPTLEEMAEGAKAVSKIPAGYNSPSSSGLTATVEKGAAVVLDFKLKTGGAPDKAPTQGAPQQGTDQFGT